MDSQDTDKIERTPQDDFAALVRTFTKSVDSLKADIHDIKIRLERGSIQLEGVAKHDDRIEELEDELIQMKLREARQDTKLSILWWALAAVGTTALGSIVTAIFALILKSHP